MKIALLTALFVLLVFAVLSPTLFGDRLMVPNSASDELYYMLPIYEFYGNAVKSGESFLWNPHIFSGFPSYVSQTAGFFDPVNILLFRFFSNIDAYYIRLGLGLVLALLFSYLAGRQFGISPLASSLIGVSYLLAFHWRFLGNLIVSNALFVLPLLFYVYRKYLASDRRGMLWLVFGGAGVGWTLISGNIQFIVYALTALTVYAFIHFLYVQDELRTPILFFRSVIVPILAICIVSVVIGLPQIAPSFAFSQQTIRGEPLDYEQATLMTLNAGDLMLLLFPDHTYFPYVTGGKKPLYVGALWFLLIIASVYALYKGRSDPADPQQRGMAAILGLLGIIIVTSIAWSPTYYLLSKLPIFGLFRFPVRWMFLGTFFMAMLGAYGLDVLQKYRAERALKRMYGLYLAFFFALTLVFIFLNAAGAETLRKLGRFIHGIFSLILYGNFGLDKEPLHYADAIERGLTAWQEFTSFTSPSFLISYSVIVLASLLVFMFLWKSLAPSTFRALAATLTIVTFLGVFAARWEFSTHIDTLHAGRSVIEQLGPETERSAFRTYPILMTSGMSKAILPTFQLTGEQAVFAKEFQALYGKPNMHIFSGARSVDGYDVFATNDMRNALALMGSDNGAEDDTWDLTIEERKETFLKHLDLLSVMSGRYVLAGEELADPRLTLVGIERTSRYDLPIYLYENADALPRYFIASSVVGVQHATFAELMKSERTDFLSKTYIDCAADCGAVNASRSDSLLLTTEKNGYAAFDVATERGGWLVFNESNIRGWRATVDGGRVAINRANGFYMAVKVPAGKHEIIFEYYGMFSEGRVLKALTIIR